MISADECRKYAADCEEMAQTAEPHNREQLLRLAREWREQAQIQDEISRGASNTLH